MPTLIRLNTRATIWLGPCELKQIWYIYISTLAHSKSQGQGNAHFGCQYFVNGDILGNLTIAINIGLSILYRTILFPVVDV